MMSFVKELLFGIFLLSIVSDGNSALPKCPVEDAYLHHTVSCNYFFHCALGHPFVKKCPIDLVFSTIVDNCVYPRSLYDDCSNKILAGGNSDTGSEENPDTGSGGNPGTGTGGNPGTVTGGNPDTVTGGNPDTGTGGNPGTVTGGNPGTVTGGNPDTGTGGNPGTGTGGNSDTGSGENPDTGYGGNPGTSTGGNPGTGTGGNPGTGTGGNPGTGTGRNPSINSRQSQVIHVFGAMSGRGDDEQSRVTCPFGSVVLNCVCSSQRDCDGSRIDDRVCSAFNGQGGSGQQAIGVCFYDNQRNWQIITVRERRRPQARCPRGFRMTACTMLNRWGHLDDIRPSADARGNVCTSSRRCINGRGCTVQAICRRV